MRRNREKLQSEFICPKCRARGAVVHEVSIGRSVTNILPLAANGYLAATCSLCGYTEFYHLAVVEKETQTADVNQTASSLLKEPE